jgi:hypothetical protein
MTKWYFCHRKAYNDEVCKQNITISSLRLRVYEAGSNPQAMNKKVVYLLL